MNEVCAVVCNWNQKDYLLRCLESLQCCDPPPDAVVVVDNASHDGSAEAVRERFPSVHLIVNERNLGGAGGFNTGLRFALENGAFRHAWLLDNDVTVEPRALAGLLEEMRFHREAAVVGSTILIADRPGLVQEFGARLDWREYELHPQLRRRPREEIPATGREVDYVPACSLLVDLERVHRVGLLDEHFFLYYDDIEWCHRFRRRGFTVRVTPASLVHHREGRRHRENYQPLYYFWRNHLRFFLQTVSGPQEPQRFCRHYIGKLAAAVQAARLMGRANAASTIVWAVMDTLRGIGGRAAIERVLPLDPPTLPPPVPAGGTVWLVGEALDFYSALEPLLTPIEGAGAADVIYFPPVGETAVPAGLAPRVRCCTGPGEADGLPDPHLLLLLSRHVLQPAAAAEERWHERAGRLGERAVFFDQHSNWIVGLDGVRRERQRFHEVAAACEDLFYPLLLDAAGRNAHG